LAIDTAPLRKILQQEHKRGYDNAAVFGGLDRFIHNWHAKTLNALTDGKLRARFEKLGLAATDYAALSPMARQEWAAGLIAALDKLEAPAAKDTQSRKKRSSTPASSAIVKPTTGSELELPVTAASGISQNLAAKFNKMGVHTIRDLLYFFPNRHLDYSQRKRISELTEGEEETVIANVWQAQETFLGGRRSTEAIVGDETGNMRVVWFNNPYLARQLNTNNRVILSGRVSMFKGRPVFQSPEWELVGDEASIHTGRLVPLYPLTQGLRPRQVRKIMKGVIDRWAKAVTEFLPADILKRRNLPVLTEAILQAHFPDDAAASKLARIRLAFDELFLLQLGVLAKKRDWQLSQPGNPFTSQPDLLVKFINSLPFSLTSAQQRVLKELKDDLAKSQPMSRLLQGDVGSGKTVVATAALLTAVANGFQGALMSPTEVLAEQHFATLCQLLGGSGNKEEIDDNITAFTGLLARPVKVALLIGNTRLKSKRQLREGIADGSIDIAIGTHALIQKEVEFRRLGLAVIDEQHRFGVSQRFALRQKGFNPHVLVMTATPIPRTLALTLYGDLDLSVISELPPGRQVIKTKWLKPEQRPSAYAFIEKQVREGHQAFIICPLVEESEAIQARAAVAEYEHLARDVFPDLKLGLVHGRQKSTEKEKTMRSFRAGELDILVATAVVEVGIDVPNATVMLVESADRFGLSQLHQFRGRVGRGRDQSYCMLLAESPSQIGQERLDIIEKTQDGFQLAEADLKLRGPGEFFGTRQSGLPDLKMARLTDVAILELARQEASRLFEHDPQLSRPEHRAVAAEMARVWATEAGEWS